MVVRRQRRENECLMSMGLFSEVMKIFWNYRVAMVTQPCKYSTCEYLNCVLYKGELYLQGGKERDRFGTWAIVCQSLV